MDLLKSLAIAASGLRAQAGRMRIISENLANADSTGATAGSDPYRRKIATFRTEMDRALGAEVVSLGRVHTDPSSFRRIYEPGHPAADQKGFVNYPNVNGLVEMTDMRDAQRSYEANLNVITASRSMLERTIAILNS
jgi:flagellar basal-body rod protein FlgC